MDKLREYLLTRVEPRPETVLDRAVLEELKRRDLMKAVFSSHRTAGTSPVPVDPAKKSLN